MKGYSSRWLALLLFVIVAFSACTDKTYEPEKETGAKNTDDISINEWIHKEMSFRYYWNDKVPSATKLNFNQSPDKFFYSTLYRYNDPQGDRFSYLEKEGVPYFARTGDATKGKNDIGFEFDAYKEINSGEYTLMVTYVKKDSNAEKQGLKRGDWIHSVDGTKVTSSNWTSILFTGKANYKLQFLNRADLNLKTTNNYFSSPIFHSQIIPIGGKRIGYIVYTRFTNGETDSSLEYALEMNALLKSFEGKIDELILDLRYNKGGVVLSGNYIASALVPNRDVAKKMIYTKRAYNKDFDAYLKQFSNYNEHIAEYFQDYVTDGKRGGIKEPIPRLNMKRLYVITSQNTASASEQIINGLSVYIPRVEVVGSTTVGKNMESYPVSDEVNKNNKWVLHPLSSVSYNSKANSPAENDYSSGFKPTIGGETLEVQGIGEEVYELGNLKERLLATAINNILGEQALRGRSLQDSPSSNSMRVGSSLDRQRSEMIISIPSEK